MMENIFEIKDLVKSYRNYSLKKVSIACNRGTIMGLVGQNGAGKSTIINILSGANEYNSGEVEIFGKKIEELTRDEKEKIGIVYDSNSLPESLRSKELNKIFKKIYKTWDEKEFYALLKRLNVPEDKTVKELSKGNKIKVNLAVALAHNPDLLILDEVTGALDPVARDEIMEMFLDFIQSEEKSIFFSSHITTDLEKVADYIVFLKDGEVVFSKEKDSLLHEYVIVRCKASKYDELDFRGIISYRESSGSYDIIWDQTKAHIEEKDGIIVEKASIEEIMLIITKGEC